MSEKVLYIFDGHKPFAYAVVSDLRKATEQDLRELGWVKAGDIRHALDDPIADEDDKLIWIRRIVGLDPTKFKVTRSEVKE